MKQTGMIFLLYLFFCAVGFCQDSGYPDSFFPLDAYTTMSEVNYFIYHEGLISGPNIENNKGYFQ
ncbi:MAG: hypothetical protein AAF399_05745, partial [Bacteroidota bacterium]